MAMQHIDDEIAKLLGAETVPDIDKALNHLRLMRAMKRLEGYSPYPKQREFHDMGRELAERLLLAGNQTGKCTPFFCEIDTGDGPVPMEALRDDMRDVLSADGQLIRPSAWFEKPPQETVRLYLSNGASVETSLDHQLALRDGAFSSVRDLLPFVLQFPGPANLGHNQSVRAEDARHWTDRVQDFQASCLAYPCQCGGPLRPAPDTGLIVPPSPDGVPEHSLTFLREDGPASRFLGSRPCSQHGHLSSSDALARIAGRFSELQVCDACKSVQRTTLNSLDAWRLRAALAVELRSDHVVSQDQFSRLALATPFNGCAWIIAWNKAGVQPIADFTVPGTHVYSAGGVLHHNSECGAAEVAMHLTGRYPPWWTGRVWDRPTTWWVAGETGETTRDSIQQKLIGPYDKPEEWGTGYIPKDCIETIRLSSHSVANSIDFVTVRHTTGGLSNVAFKSYGKGRKRWQAVTIDGIWFDEEPPADVYSEGQTRVNVLQGSILITFTPLQGMSEVVGLFLTPEQVERMMVDARER